MLDKKLNIKSFMFSLLVLITWCVYMFFFLPFYEEAFFYVDKSASYWHQFVFFIESYLNQLLLFAFLFFFLLIGTFFFLYLFYLKYKKQGEGKPALKVISVLSVLFLPFLYLLFVNLLGPVFLVVGLFSFAVCYTIYYVTKDII